jgi:hypothetical protein
VAALIYSCLTLSPTAEESGESKCNGRKETGSTKQARQRYSPQLDAAASASTETDTRKTQDGRRFSRYACGSQVQFRHENSDQVLCGELANLSLTGCYIQTTQPCAVDTGLEVVVQVGRARIYSPARVKTVRAGEGMGIEFTGDLPQRLRRLQRFVQVLSAAGRPQNNPKN